MDLRGILQGLYAEKRRLERVITSMEAVLKTAPSKEGERDGVKRGRKSMASKERQEVSARMKKYWADRRKQKERT